MANQKRCPGHRWAYPLFQRGPTSQLRVIAVKMGFVGGFRCTVCGAPGRRSGDRIQAFAPARAADILKHVEGWNRRCAEARESGQPAERRAA